MESKVVEAIGMISISSTNKELSKRIQSAIGEAILVCNARGISTAEVNSPLIRECMMAVREAVKRRFPKHVDVEDTVDSFLAAR